MVRETIAVLDLRSGFLETVGNRVPEAQRAAFAHGGVPRVGPAPRAGWLEERLVEPRLDRILGRVVAMCVSGADEYRGALGVAAHHGHGGQAAEPFERHRPDDHFAAEREFLAERVRSGVGLTGQERGQTDGCRC